VLSQLRVISWVAQHCDQHLQLEATLLLLEPKDTFMRMRHASVANMARLWTGKQQLLSEGVDS
jgi:hypothetical protein